MTISTRSIIILDNEIQFLFVQSGGPGGQNVNKVATTVQLRLNVGDAGGIPSEVKARLIKIAGRRVSGDGILTIESSSHRSQARNKDETINKLVALLERAEIPPQKRRPTIPTHASQVRRVETKRLRSALKRLRRYPKPTE